MENYTLLPNEVDLENRLRNELKIAESDEDPEITYMQYLFVNAFEGEFPGVLCIRTERNGNSIWSILRI